VPHVAANGCTHRSSRSPQRSFQTKQPANMLPHRRQRAPHLLDPNGHHPIVTTDVSRNRYTRSCDSVAAVFRADRQRTTATAPDRFTIATTTRRLEAATRGFMCSLRDAIFPPPANVIVLHKVFHATFFSVSSRCFKNTSGIVPSIAGREPPATVRHALSIVSSGGASTIKWWHHECHAFHLLRRIFAHQNSS
jgi:hypothetical protein